MHSRLAAVVGVAVLAVSTAACSSAASPTPVASAPAASVAASATATAAASIDAAVVGRQAVDRFFTILKEDVATRAADLDAILAPEFQVVRANGDVQSRASYLASAPSVSTYTVSDVVATQANGSLVVSYHISTTETVSGVPQTTTAPRLTVFREVGTSWLLVSHSNFGAIK